MLPMLQFSSFLLLWSSALLQLKLTLMIELKKLNTLCQKLEVDFGYRAVREFLEECDSIVNKIEKYKENDTPKFQKHYEIYYGILLKRGMTKCKSGEFQNDIKMFKEGMEDITKFILSFSPSSELKARAQAHAYFLRDKYNCNN